MTAHFNEIDRLTSRFFVKIPALRRIAERIRRRLRLSWSRSALRAAPLLSIAKASNRRDPQRLNSRN
ncbi:hypothetical protein SB758_20220 [Burkholderia sp. SIMBA_013]|nr:hypothetical protein MYA_1749 [Burkholderia sp. KJ006]